MRERKYTRRDGTEEEDYFNLRGILLVISIILLAVIAALMVSYDPDKLDVYQDHDELVVKQGGSLFGKIHRYPIAYNFKVVTCTNDAVAISHKVSYNVELSTDPKKLMNLNPDLINMYIKDALYDVTHQYSSDYMYNNKQELNSILIDSFEDQLRSESCYLYNYSFTLSEDYILNILKKIKLEKKTMELEAQKAIIEADGTKITINEQLTKSLLEALKNIELPKTMKGE